MTPQINNPIEDVPTTRFSPTFVMKFPFKDSMAAINNRVNKLKTYANV